MTLPYWLDEPPPPVADVRVERPDAVLVGGGITGRSCALALARGGLRVRLQDAREIAGGASGRNGGFALRGTAAAYDVAVASLGRDRAGELWRWTEQGLDRVDALAGDAFRRIGSLRLAADEEERDELRREYEALRADGFAAEWMDDVEPQLAGRFPGALLHPPDGVLQPARFVRRLAFAAAEAGVEIREHARVDSLDEVDAEQVVVATDGYPSGLLGRLEGLIIPTRAQMIATEPLSELLFESIRYGLDHRAGALAHAARYGRGLDADLTDRFVGMYVNDRTLDYGEDGRAAVAELLGRAHAAGLLEQAVPVDFIE